MFSANAMSSLPISDDGKKPRTFFGSVKIFLNKATLAFPLYFNTVQEFSLGLNLVNSLSLSRNILQEFVVTMNATIFKSLNFNKLLSFTLAKANINKQINFTLQINKIIDFSQRR